MKNPGRNDPCFRCREDKSFFVGGSGFPCVCVIITQKNVRNPKLATTTTSQKSIAVHLQFVLRCFRCPYARWGKGNTVSTPPVCIAVRLPFVSRCFWKNLGGCGHRDVPQGKPTPKTKQGFCYLFRTSKIPGKEGKTLKKN